MRLTDNLKRLFIAWTMAVVSAGICLWRGDVRLDNAHPSTLFDFFHQRWGILAVLCIGWLWFEAVWMVISPAGSRLTLRWPRGRWERRRWVRGS